MSDRRRWKQWTSLRRESGKGKEPHVKLSDEEGKTVWNGVYTYEAYGKALEEIKRDFPTNYLIGDIPQILSQIHRPKLIIRHDVVYSLEKALAMSRLEHDLGLRAAYMVRSDSPLIPLESPTSRKILNEIRSLGHEIGLNVSTAPASLSPGSLARSIRAECARLSRQLEFPVLAVSLAGPAPAPAAESLFIGDRVNATSSVMMKWTLSDAEAAWNIQSPRPAEEDPDRALLQVIARPAVWGMEDIPPRERLEALTDEALDR